LQNRGAAAPGGWPCLEKIDAPRHRSARDILGSAARSGDARYHLNCCTQLTRISEVLGGRETFTRSELSGFGPKALIDLATSPSSPELPAREFAPSAKAASFAHAIWGWTRPPRPQSVLAITFSRPTICAKRMSGDVLSQSSASGDGADVRFGQTRSFGDVCSMSALLEGGRRSALLRCRKSVNSGAVPPARRCCSKGYSGSKAPRPAKNLAAAC